jgi:hypothetical protein
MKDTKYIGLDVHQATISVAVLDSSGKLVKEAILETKAETILQFVHGLRGSLRVTLEEGTCAAWLHDVLKPHVAQVLVFDPRKNAITATAHKLAHFIYPMVTAGQEYHETVCAQNEMHHRRHLEARLRKQARELGLQLIAAS